LSWSTRFEDPVPGLATLRSSRLHPEAIEG
jgi:hypothetical protein